MELTPNALAYLTLAGLSTVLFMAHVMLQGFLATQELGSQWNAGPRDDGRAPEGKIAGRAARASANFRETYPVFAVLVLALAIRAPAGDLGLIGAWTWAIARIVYYPLYLAGIPYIRSLVWLVSILGLALMFVALL